MLDALKKLQNRTKTENEAVTYSSTFNCCLDLFATIAALRSESKSKIRRRFSCAYTENSDLAMKILFFARDVRGGLGERRVFRTIIKWLAKTKKETILKNIQYFAEYGRYDDLFELFNTPCEKEMLAFIRDRFNADLDNYRENKPISLLAKWMPSINTSSKQSVYFAKRIALFLNVNEEKYRKSLSALRSTLHIIENNLRMKDYTFNYSKQPSRAMWKYRAAFRRNDHERYGAFLDDVSSGNTILHTDTLYPYDIVNDIIGRDSSELDVPALDVSWNSLKSFVHDENALVVIDGSASMYGYGNPTPAAVAISLGLYFAEKNTGLFHNHFITFSQSPRLVEIKGKNIVDKVRYCIEFNERSNTNIQKIFELILAAALNKKATQKELPSTLYIISDMEFDSCAEDADMTNFEYAKKLFEEHGYHLPRLVFWNVQSRNIQQPVTMNEQGVALVSGCSPRIFSLLEKDDLSPMSLMLEILNSERYAPIKA
ncbi:MAG: DUF2828 family protein [Desulfovibrio sp.]|nr:DUF2828 family protein [Desulfovibrio sp.]